MSVLKVLQPDSNFREHLSEVVSAESIVSVTDINGIIVYVNENFCRISGFDESELIGKHHRIINSGFHSKDFFVNMWDEIKAGKTWKGEIKNKRKDGSYYWVMSSIVPIKNQMGSIEYFISVRQEITKEKEAQASLIQASKLSALGEVTAKVAHELNNPLSVIMGMAQVLINRKEVDEKSMERVHKILKSAERMDRLIQQMKKHSRDTKNDPKQALSLAEVVKNSMVLLEATLASNQIQMKIDLPDSAPSIWGDFVQLESVIMNLITNSIDAFIKPHIQNSISERSISIGLSSISNSLVLIYKDNAGGIPPHVQKHMFDTFFTTKEIGKGTGLGLSVIKNAVLDHGAELTFNSQLGIGTEFQITFPILQSKDRY